ncbi:MAG: hypothetical protein Q8S18_12830 [Bacteroidales bacterium]|nr:hypothetical protein [Bacteroidales bacterium]
MKTVNTPILFITFARPEYAKKTFEAIKKVKPRKLYFYNNIARPDNSDEINRNRQVRALLKEIDWECEVETFFREDHADIYTSLFSAIDWVFENEEQAIILEEDCVATPYFFYYCEELLNKYKADSRVWMISGNNFTEDGFINDTDYFFSRFSHIYGWASWKDRWKKIDRAMEDHRYVIDSGIYEQYFLTKKQARHVKKKFVNFKKNNLPALPAWDFLFWYSAIKNNAFTIFPKKHLVGNIGVIGHHNKKGEPMIWNREPIPIEKNPFTLKHPMFIYPDNSYDRFHFNRYIKKYSSTNQLALLAKKIAKAIIRKFYK